MPDKENTIEDEIDAIRLKLYEKTKNMSYEEFKDFIKTETKPINEQFRLKSISGIDDFVKQNISK
jgi:hypothetical protein